MFLRWRGEAACKRMVALCEWLTHVAEYAGIAKLLATIFVSIFFHFSQSSSIAFLCPRVGMDKHHDDAESYFAWPLMPWDFLGCLRCGDVSKCLPLSCQHARSLQEYGYPLLSLFQCVTNSIITLLEYVWVCVYCVREYVWGTWIDQHANCRCWVKRLRGYE